MNWEFVLRRFLLLWIIIWLAWQIAGALLSNLGHLALVKSKASAGLKSTNIITYAMPVGGNQAQLAEALGYFQAALEIRPGLPQALAGCARVYSEQGLVSEALNSWEKVARSGKMGDLGEFILGNLSAQAGNRTKALVHWEHAVPADTQRRIMLAWKVFSQGRGDYDSERWSDAVQVLEDTLRTTSLDYSGRAELYIVMSDMYASLSSVDQALHYAEQATAIMPESARTHAWLARAVYLYTQDEARAMAEAQRSMRLGLNWWANLVMGDIHLKQCDLDEAIVDYQSGLKLKSNGDWRHVYLLEGLALAYWESGDRNAALASWNKFLDLQPIAERIRLTLEQAEQGILPRRCAGHD